MVSGVNMKKKAKKNSEFVLRLLNGANCFYDRIFRALYITLLFVLDFVMFVYSINGRLMDNGVFNEAILWIVGGVFGIALVLMFLLSFSGLAQNIICTAMTMLLTLVFFYQFALFDIDNFIEVWLAKNASALTFIGVIPSAILIALLLGCVIFFAFGYTFPIILFCFALATSIIVGVWLSEFEDKQPVGEYVVTKDFNNTVADKDGSSLVYFMLPRFPSYHFLSTVKDINFRELRDLMIGFYAVNDFEIYPNAFVQKNNTVSNIVDIYNQVDYTSTKSGIRGYAEIINDWNFVHGSLNNFALEDNLLYQELKKSGYRVSTYPMPEFNFCYNKDNMDTDRCVEKANKVAPLYDDKSTLEKNIYALLGEWVLSLNSKNLNFVAKMLIDSSYLRGMKVISQNRRVSEEGSAALLGQVGSDYARDGSGVAYMAYVDLPSDFYIYDEFCNIKPRKNWVAMKDNTLVRGGIDAKRQAYADQAKCAIGLLQMFMEDFLQDEKRGKTDVIVQGVSTIKEFSSMSAGQYENFVSDKLVSLGIRKASSPEFVVDTKVCLASDITKTLITGNESCYSLDNMKMSSDEQYNLEQNLRNNAVIRGGLIISIAENYRDWYEEFKNNSPFYKAKRERVIEERVRREMQLEAEARRAYLNNSQLHVSENQKMVLPVVEENKVSEQKAAVVEDKHVEEISKANDVAKAETVLEVSDSSVEPVESVVETVPVVEEVVHEEVNSKTDSVDASVSEENVAENKALVSEKQGDVLVVTEEAEVVEPENAVVESLQEIEPDPKVNEKSVAVVDEEGGDAVAVDSLPKQSEEMQEKVSGDGKKVAEQVIDEVQDEVKDNVDSSTVLLEQVQEVNLSEGVEEKFAVEVVEANAIEGEVKETVQESIE